MGRRGAGAQPPQASVERASFAPSGEKVGIEMTRDYDNSHFGYMRRGQRTMISRELAKQIMDDHKDDAPIKLVEYTEEEKAAIEGAGDACSGEKNVESPENRMLESPETK